MPRPHRHQQGISKLTFLVFSALIGVAIYTGYHVFPFYYYHLELQNQFDSATRIASAEPDSEIRKRLMYHIDKMALPIEPEDLKVYRERNVVTISLEYEEVFSISWRDKEYEIMRFPFTAYAQRDF